MRDNDVVAGLARQEPPLAADLGAGHRRRDRGTLGGLLVGFITLWDPQAWGYAETIVLFAAVIIGGRGNHRGAVLGAILVPLALRGGDALHPTGTERRDLVPRAAVGRDRPV